MKMRLSDEKDFSETAQATQQRQKVLSCDHNPRGWNQKELGHRWVITEYTSSYLQ